MQCIYKALELLEIFLEKINTESDDIIHGISKELHYGHLAKIIFHGKKESLCSKLLQNYTKKELGKI